MKLSSGPARIGDLRAAGVVVGLGSDGEKENNNLDLVEEMKFASLLQKVSTLDPTVGRPVGRPGHGHPRRRPRARASTTSPARSSRASGPTSITVDLDGLHTTPVLHGRDFNVAAHLVFSASGRDVARRVGRRPPPRRRRCTDHVRRGERA